MKKLICTVLISVMALNLCSCSVFRSVKTVNKGVRKAVREATRSETTVPQGQAFSLDGMSTDEIMNLCDSLTDIKNGDDPLLLPSKFPVPFYPDQSNPEAGDFCFYEDDNADSLITYLDYDVGHKSDLIDTDEFCYVEIAFSIKDKKLALELFEKFDKKLHSWNGKYVKDWYKHSGDFHYCTVTYDDPLGYKGTQRFTVQMSAPDKGYYYHVQVEYPVVRK